MSETMRMCGATFVSIERGLLRCSRGYHGTAIDHYDANRNESWPYCAATASQPIPARGETTPDHGEAMVRGFASKFARAMSPAASLPVEPAGTPETTPDALLTAVEDNLRWLVNVATEGAHAERDGDNDRAGHYINERVPLHRDRLRAMFAALTSEVSRLQKNWDEAYEVHESDKIEIIDLRAEVSALREAVEVLSDFARTAPGRLPERVQKALAPWRPPTRDVATRTDSAGRAHTESCRGAYPGWACDCGATPPVAEQGGGR